MTSFYLEQPLRSELQARKDAHETALAQFKESVVRVKRNFDPNWPHGHETLRGFPARIVGRLKNPSDPLFPIVVIVEDSEGEDSAETYTENGLFSLDHPDSTMHLRNKSAP